VIVAHAATLGCFDLFLQIADEFNDLVYADLAAVTKKNRSVKVLTALLDRTDLHPRFVNGSDYPLPAINIMIWTRDMVKHGFMTAEERVYLNDIYRDNPLLFDFVLKRTIRSPKTHSQFPEYIFI
jgi:mannonate dehydratase